MRKIALILLIIIITLLTVLTGSLLLLSRLHHQSAHQELVRLINKELDEEVAFGDFSFSYLRRFPRVHIRLDDVRIHDGKREVLHIGELDVLLNLKGLWKKEINLDKLVIQHAMLISEVDSLGNKPHLFAGNKQNGDTLHKSMILDLRRIIVRDSRLNLGNLVKGNQTYLKIDEANFRLATEDSLLSVSGELLGVLDTMISNHTVLFSNQPVRISDVLFRMNGKTKEKRIERGEIFAHNLKLTPRLSMKPMEGGQWVDLHISGDGNFNDFLDLIELRTGVDVSQVNPNALLSMSYNQQGFVDPYTRPYSELDFKISDAELTGKNLPYPLEISFIKGNYNNGESHSSLTAQLVIDTVHVDMHESFLRGRFKLNNLKDPIIDADLKAFINFNHLIGETAQVKLDGSVDLDLRLKGKIRDLKKMHYSGYLGSLQIHNVKLVLKELGYTIDLFSGSAVLKNHILTLDNLKGAFNQSVFHIEGSIRNPLLHMVDQQENLAGKVAVSVEEFDLTDMKSPGHSEKKSKGFPIRLLDHISLDITVKGKKIITRNGSIENFLLACNQKYNSIHIKTVGFNYQDGTVKGSGNIILGGSGMVSTNLDLEGNFRNLDLNSLKQNKDRKATAKRPFKIPENVNARMQLQIANAIIGNIGMGNLNLIAEMHEQELTLQKLSMNALDGKISANGKMTFDSTGISGVWLNMGMEFNRLSMDQLLTEFSGKNDKGQRSNFSKFPDQIAVNVLLNARELDYYDASITNLRTTLEVSRNQIIVKDFYADLPFGKLTGQFSVNNFRSEKDINISSSIDLNIDTLSIDQLLVMEALKRTNPRQEKESTKVGRSGSGLADIPQNADLSLKINARQLSYHKALLSNYSLHFIHSGEKSELRKLNFNFGSGTVDMHGFLQYNARGNIYPGYLNTQISNLDINELLRSFDSFNQEIITPENTSGLVSLNSTYYFELFPNFKPNPDKNLVMVDMLVHDAQLKHIQPVEKALFFIGHKAKSNMIISDLEIKAVYFKNNLFFSELIMNDNIANLEVFGLYSTKDASMDLGSRISLTDLFFRSKDERIVETLEGKINLDKDSKIFLRMQGYLPEHKLKLSTKRKIENYRQQLEGEIRKANKAFERLENERRKSNL